MYCTRHESGTLTRTCVSTCLCICLCVCLILCVCLHRCGVDGLHLFVHVYFLVCLFDCVWGCWFCLLVRVCLNRTSPDMNSEPSLEHMCLCVYQFVYLCVCLHMCGSDGLHTFRLSVFVYLLFVCLLDRVSACLFVCLCVRVCVWLCVFVWWFVLNVSVSFPHKLDISKT